MPSVKLLRPDGTTFDVDASQAGRFAVLGYKQLDTETANQVDTSAGRKEYFSTPGQKVLAGMEGIESGVSLGLTDQLWSALGDTDFRERAGANPGTRMLTELGGALLPAVVTEGALAGTPAGALATGAELGSEALGLGKVGTSVARGAIEGAGFGAGGAISQAAINNDPLTTDSLVAGMGWGALFGGGLGGLTGVVEAKGAARLAARADEEAQASAAAKAIEDGYKGFRNTIVDAEAEIGKAVDATADLKRVTKATKASMRGAIDSAEAEYSRIVKDFTPQTRDIDPQAMAEHIDLATKALDEVRAAAKEGNPLRMQIGLDLFKEYSGGLAKMNGLTDPALAPFSYEAASTAQGAAKEMAKMAAAQPVLKSFPIGPEEFAKMSSSRADKLAGAVDSIMKTTSPELAGVRESIKRGVAGLGDALGVTIEGSPAVQLRGVYEAAKGAAKRATAEEISRSGWMASAAKRGAENSGGKLASGLFGKGAGRPVAYEAGKQLVRAMLSIKAGVLGTISKAATDWAPVAAGKLARPIGSRIGALKVRLDGTEDRDNKTADALLKARSEEILSAAPGVRDTLYKNLGGLAQHQPDLAVSMHSAAVEKFQWLLDKVPRDPGLAFSNMKSLYKVDPVAREKFARYYEVFQNPTAVMTTALRTGQITVEGAEGLREMYPPLFNALRFEMLNRLADKKVQKAMTYAQQVHIGTLLDLPVHSTMMPQFISNQQQMFQQRNQLQPISPQPGVGNSSGGRPAASTKAQQITAH